MLSRATLNPAPDESVDWDTTKNTLIEARTQRYRSFCSTRTTGNFEEDLHRVVSQHKMTVCPDNYADPLTY
jgi:hypothetical protein